jgi:hypothetical protein
MITHTRAAEIARKLNGLRGSQSAGQWLAYDRDGNGGNTVHTSPYGLGDDVIVLRIPQVGQHGNRITAPAVLAEFTE